MSISVGWNTAKAAGVTREEMDAWAFRSHMRAIAAIDAGKFVDEIAPIKVTAPDGSVREFAVDEHPRRSSTLEKLASLKVLHPEIPGFSITAGNSSGVNDAAAAVTLTSQALAEAEGLTPIEIDGPEVPIMDGSAAAFVAAIERAGIVTFRRRAVSSRFSSP